MFFLLSLAGMVPREVGATKNSFHASRYLHASTENSLFLSKNGEAKPSIYAQIKVCLDGAVSLENSIAAWINFWVRRENLLKCMPKA